VVEVLTTNVNKEACATEVNLGPTLLDRDCQFSISCAIIIWGESSGNCNTLTTPRCKRNLILGTLIDIYGIPKIF
jgi:hypothetical protein